MSVPCALPIILKLPNKLAVDTPILVFLGHLLSRAPIPVHRLSIWGSSTTTTGNTLGMEQDKRRGLHLVNWVGCLNREYVVE